MTTSGLVRIGDASAITGLSPNTLRKYAALGLIPTVSVGNQRRFRVADLERLVVNGLPTIRRHRHTRGRGIQKLHELRLRRGDSPVAGGAAASHPPHRRPTPPTPEPDGDCMGQTPHRPATAGQEDES